MRNIVRSELLKLRSTQVWFWLLVLSVLFTAAVSAGAVSGLEEGAPQTDYVSIFTAAQGGGIAMLVIGLLGFTTEFRHRTVTPTLLATPRRSQMVAGKAITYVGVAFAYATVCIAVNLAVAIPWLSSKGIPVELGGDVPGAILKCWVLLMYAVLFGLALGAVVRHQAAAIAGGLIYFAVLNNIWSIVPKVRIVWPFSPAGAAQAFASVGGLEGYSDDVPKLTTGQAGLVMIAWVVVPLLVSAWLMRRRDIS